MTQIQIDWWSWLTSSATELAARGVPRANLSSLRYENTGLRRAMSPQWASTIGMWGGQKTVKEVRDFLGVSVEDVHAYIAYWGLRVCKKGSAPRRQVEIAIDAYSAQDSELSVRKQATLLGILPPEMLYYIKKLEAFKDQLGEDDGYTIARVIEEHGLDDLEEIWVDCHFRLESPKPDEDEQAKERILAQLRRGE